MKTTTKNITEEKSAGRFYTPEYIVNIILDMSEYSGRTILKKHVIDNSCGDGAFLTKIVQRYIEEGLIANIPLDEIKADLSTYIHGIELDETEKDKSIDNVSAVAANYCIQSVNWDINSEDALSCKRYDGKMDFVLGNPPYVRVHNLGDSFDNIKSFSFAQSGMTDIYIVFYEIGIRMLKKDGVLGYITPSSFYNSVAGTFMREVFVKDKLMKIVVNLKHHQPFQATTYTTIVILQKGNTKTTIRYYDFDECTLSPEYIDELVPDDFYIDGNFYFTNKKSLEEFRKIFYNEGITDISVKNGYATLCDQVFISNFEFQSKFIIDVVKASRGIKKQAFFPYDVQGKLIPEEEIAKDKKIYQYLKNNKDKLTNRSNEKLESKYWYAYGRSQAIIDTFKKKLCINSLLRNENDIKFTEAGEKVGVYSGLYILSNTFSILDIKKVLQTSEFMEYVKLLGKYKSGGYYTFSSKDVKRFLDYKFSYNRGLYLL